MGTTARDINVDVFRLTNGSCSNTDYIFRNQIF